MMNVDWRHSQDALSPDDNNLLLADPVFRHAARCLDLAHVAAQLGAAFPALQIDAGLQASNVWYVPGKSLQVVYRVRRQEGRTIDRDALLRVRFCASGQGPDETRIAPMRARNLNAVRSVAGLQAVASLFPEDDGLPQLADIVNSDGIAHQLKLARPCRVLSYLPATRCALRSGVPSDPDALVIRVQKPEAAARSHAIAHAAWGAASRRFLMPEPLGCEPRAGVAWERFAPGSRLDSLRGHQFQNALQAVIEGLVHLHALRLEHLPVEGLDEILKRTARVLPKARLAVPALRSELDGAMRMLTARASEVHEQDSVVIHGDLHTANLLVRGDSVVFIDLDRLSRGNPACDLALLGTRLLLVALTSGDDVHAIARTVAQFPDLYHEAGGRPIDRATYAWYIAALLVSRQIKTTIRHLAPHARDVCRTLLTWAQRTLERGSFDVSIVSDESHEACRVNELAIPA